MNLERSGAPLADGLDHVRLSVVRDVGWLEFNRPPINAFNEQMVQETILGFQRMERSADVRVIVLASALDRYFSAGAELQIFEGIGTDGMREWVRLVHQVVTTIRALTKPALAAIAGTAVGGGLEMALHCDIRFVDPESRLGQPEVNLNFIPPVGATQALVRLIGRPAALRYLYDGALLDARQAKEIGLVDDIVAPGQLRTSIQRYAESLAQKPPEALAAIRRAIVIGGALSFSDGLALEADLATDLAGTANFKEGVRAFLDKRPPEWTVARSTACDPPTGALT